LAKKLIWALTRNLLGWAMVVLGVLFGWLPVVQGTLLVVVGLSLADWPGKRRGFRYLRTFPWFNRIDDWSHQYLGFRLPEHPEAPLDPSKAFRTHPEN
jgi:hypothetical protein